MRVTEPTTMLTDYVLGVWSAVLGWRLLGLAGLHGGLSQRLWAAGLIATAVSAFAGGTAHGFTAIVTPAVRRLFWKTTLYTAGLAGSCFLAAALLAFLPDPWRSWLLGFVAVEFVAYLVWMTGHDDFKFVAFHYGPALLAVLIMYLAAGRASGRGSNAIIAGVLLSFLGGAVQRLRLAPHRHFNHNDLFHIIYMGVVWFFYKGGLLLVNVG